MVEYRLEVEKTIADSPGCYDHDMERANQTTTWVLNSIQPWTNTDGDPDTPDGGIPLPITTFENDPLPNFHNNMEECFRFMRLAEYKNGYGGIVSFAYENDGDGGDVRGRAIGVYERLGSNLYRYPGIGYSWHVSSVGSQDGRNPELTVDYTFESPCYDQYDANLEGNWGVMAGAAHCTSSDAPQYGSAVGFEWTTQTFYDYLGSIIRTEKTRFHRVNEYLGKANRYESYDSDNYLISASVTPYTTTVNGPTTFAYSYLVQTSSYNAGGGPSITTNQTFDYDAGLQGNLQYGNQTTVWDYGDRDVSGDETTTVRCFYPNVTDGHWIVNKLAAEKVFDGINESPTESMCAYNYGTDLLYETRNLFDNNDYVNGPPGDQGALTAVKAGAYGTDLGGGQNGVITATVTTYDDFGNIATTVDAAEATTTIEYDPDYNLYPISVTNDLGHETSFEIYGFNGVPLEPDFDNTRRQAGLLRKATDPNGVEVIYEYDPHGRLWAEYESEVDVEDPADRWDGNASKWYHYYDNVFDGGKHHLDPANDEPFVVQERIWPFVYNMGAIGYEYKYLTYFDGFGRPIQQQDLSAEVDGQAGRRDIIVSTEYSAQGPETCITVPRDVESYYDRVDWPSETTFISDDCESLDHTGTAYDDFSRPIIITAPNGSETSIQYDITDNTTVNGVSVLHRQQTTDVNDHMVKSFFDGRGQLVKVREHTGEVSGELEAYADTEYTYDWQGNLIQVQNRKPHQTGEGALLSEIEMDYDALGRKTWMDDADMGQWNYHYDAAGNLIRQIDAIDQNICLYYDSLGRPVREVWITLPDCPSLPDAPSDGPSHLASYAYDTAVNGIGKLARSSWGYLPEDNNDAFSYDTEGRMYSQTRVLDGRDYTMSTLLFDALDRPEQIQYPNGEVVEYSYDKEGEETLTAGADLLITGATYNAQGQMVHLGRGNGVDTSFTYYDVNANPGTGDNLSRLQTIEHGMADDAFPRLDYYYDVTGNILANNSSWTDGIPMSESESYQYDELNRLTEVAGSGNPNLGIPAYHRNYAYNEIGNITNFAGEVFTYEDPAHTHAVTHIDGFERFSYESNGNKQVRYGESIVYNQSFDAKNRLSTVFDGSISNTSFGYDTGEQRVHTTVTREGESRTITYYPYPNYEEEVRQEWQYVEIAPGQFEWTWVTTETVQRNSYSFAGQVVATEVNSASIPPSDGIYYIYTNHLGSTKFLTDEGGQQVGEFIRYLPYGGYRTETTTEEITDRGFTGHRHNDQVGLIYMNARFYVPYIARFASADTLVPDPGNPQSFNRYSYTLNNPIRYTDPSGHCGADMNWPSGGGWEYRDEVAYSRCVDIRDAWEQQYGIDITGEWLLAEMYELGSALANVYAALMRQGLSDGAEAFSNAFGAVEISRMREWRQNKNGDTINARASFGKKIMVYDGAFRRKSSNNRYSRKDHMTFVGTIAHELGHIWDQREWFSLSTGLRDEVNGHGQACLLSVCTPGAYTVDGPQLSRRSDINQYEYWAEAFRHLVVDPAKLARHMPREAFVIAKVQGLER